MDASVLLALRDPAGIPFYPVVFSGFIYINMGTSTLHCTFTWFHGDYHYMVHLNKKNDPNWKILTTRI